MFLRPSYHTPSSSNKKCIPYDHSYGQNFQILKISAAPDPEIKYSQVREANSVIAGYTTMVLSLSYAIIHKNTVHSVSLIITINFSKQISRGLAT